MLSFSLQTTKKEEFIDITARVKNLIESLAVKNGLVSIFVPHTTCGLTINENADPDVKSDILLALRKAVPDNLAYAHLEGNSTAHIKASLVGSSVNLIIENGQLLLGTWQGIFLCEFDGPRTRKVWLKIIETD
ncbi:MAG: YjbQ family protein [Candidatus Aminicenantes bacterium]|jgi:secondary thiamine-phosphate synthase enzyme|nr:YjbQ family protein [Candidatus Aminicenantes bacterium]